MLKEIRVSNIALIDEATIEFSPGLTVLSGETGAGKTALLFSLKMLMGERADSFMVRDGEEAATVEGVFEESGRLICVKRRLSADGRSRCWIDGRPVSVGELSKCIAPLLELHGQHEHQSLLDPGTHVAYLDMWIGEDAASALDAYKSAYYAQASAKAEYDEMLRISKASQHDIDDARFTLREIQALNPIEGEYEQLEAELPALEHADSLARSCEAALDVLRCENGAGDKLSASEYEIGKVLGIDSSLDEIASRISSLVLEADDIAMELRSYCDGIERDPRALQERLDRLSELDGLCRRFGPRMIDVFERAAAAQRTLDLVDDSQELLAKAKGALDAAEAQLLSAATRLSQLRCASADEFSAALTGAVAGLGMKGASFNLAMSDLPRSAWTLEGNQHIELLYSPGSGVTARPLAKIASGGELSRVMLALKGSVDVGDARSLVFDEVDTGIGGSTANLVAERLCELAQDHQVIAVTHLAQIAAKANTQLLVSKSGGEDGRIPMTSIRPLLGDERCREIARMLSGNSDAAAMEHARSLLEA